MDNLILFIILSIAGAFSRTLLNQLRKTINTEKNSPQKHQNEPPGEKQSRYTKTVRRYR